MSRRRGNRWASGCSRGLDSSRSCALAKKYEISWLFCRVADPDTERIRIPRESGSGSIFGIWIRIQVLNRPLNLPKGIRKQPQKWFFPTFYQFVSPEKDNTLSVKSDPKIKEDLKYCGILKLMTRIRIKSSRKIRIRRWWIHIRKSAFFKAESTVRNSKD